MFVDNGVHEGQQEMKHFISPDLWLPKSSSVLDQVDCQIWRLMQERVYRTPIHNSRDLKQRPTDTPASYHKTSSTKLLINWESSYVYVGRKDIILNVC